MWALLSFVFHSLAWILEKKLTSSVLSGGDVIFREESTANDHLWLPSMMIPLYVGERCGDRSICKGARLCRLVQGQRQGGDPGAGGHCGWGGGSVSVVDWAWLIVFGWPVQKVEEAGSHIISLVLDREDVSSKKVAPISTRWNADPGVNVCLCVIEVELPFQYWWLRGLTLGADTTDDGGQKKKCCWQTDVRKYTESI